MQKAMGIKETGLRSGAADINTDYSLNNRKSSKNRLGAHAPIFIDLEASGIGQGSYPIEVGVVMASGEEFSCLINPLPSWVHWDTKAENVHGISRQELLKHGRPAVWVAEKLNELLRGMTIYCDAWVLDKPWLDRLFDSVGVARAFHISPVETIMDEDGWEDWGEAKARITPELGIRLHRALDDAKLIRATYLSYASG